MNVSLYLCLMAIRIDIDCGLHKQTADSVVHFTTPLEPCNHKAVSGASGGDFSVAHLCVVCAVPPYRHHSQQKTNAAHD